MYERPVSVAYDPKEVKELVNQRVEPALKGFQPDWQMVVDMMRMPLMESTSIASLVSLASDWEGQYAAISVLESLDVLRDANEGQFETLEHIGHEWELVDQIASDLMGLFFNLEEAYLPECMGIYMGHPYESADYGIQVYLEEEAAYKDIKYITKKDWPHKSHRVIYPAYDFAPLAWVVVNDEGEVMTTFEPDEYVETEPTWLQVAK